MVRGHVASDHGWLVILSRPGRSGGDEPGVEAIGGCRALNTRLSSGTSAGTFACPAGPYRKCWDEAGTKNEPKWYFVPVQKKGSESRSSRFEPKISLISFSRGSGPPLRLRELPVLGTPPSNRSSWENYRTKNQKKTDLRVSILIEMFGQFGASKNCYGTFESNWDLTEVSE